MSRRPLAPPPPAEGAGPLPPACLDGVLRILDTPALQVARFVREALRGLAAEAHASGHWREAAAFDALDVLGTDERLAQLGRLLR